MPTGVVDKECIAREPCKRLGSSSWFDTDHWSVHCTLATTVPVRRKRREGTGPACTWHHGRCWSKSTAASTDCNGGRCHGAGGVELDCAERRWEIAGEEEAGCRDAEIAGRKRVNVVRRQEMGLSVSAPVRGFPPEGQKKNRGHTDPPQRGTATRSRSRQEPGCP